MTLLRILRFTLRSVCGLVISGGVVYGQSAAFAELHGTIYDASGAAIPAAALVLIDEERGLRRAVVTDDRGQYRFLSLSPSKFTLRLEKPGFQVRAIENVILTVGQIALLDGTLELAERSEAISVYASPSMIDFARGQQANTLVQSHIDGLPINRRDYLNFALLAPGVTDANTLADSTDFRTKQTPQSGLSFYGSNGRGNSVTLDGSEANNASGGVRSTVSQEAVQEFQIRRSNYSAEMGGASGGIVNIVSRSGTNSVTGSLFGFFRHQSMDAGNPFAQILEGDTLVRVKPPSERQQFGGSLGGPISNDRTFYFVALETMRRRESNAVPLLTDRSIFQPTPAQELVLWELPPATAAALRAALTSSPSTVRLFEENSGVFPYSSDDWKWSVRLDHRLNQRHDLYFRHNGGELFESDANLQALVGASRGLDTTLLDPTTAAGWTHVVSPRAVNEARVQWNYRRFDVVNRERFGPELRINGFGIFNRDYLLPSRNTERRYEVRDNLSYIRGSHLLRTGFQILVRGARSESEVFFGGRFTFGELPARVLNASLPPSLTITGLQAFNLGLSQSFIMGAGDPTVAETTPYFGVYVEDTWRLRPNLSFELGLRYERDVRVSPLPTDNNNLAPRFSFAWSPWSDRKTAVRGGYGIFYSPTYYQIDWSVRALNDIGGYRQIAQVFSSIQTPGPAAAQNIFTTLQRQGVITLPTPTRALAPEDLMQFGLAFANTGALPPFSILFENSPDFRSPYAQQASLAVERQLTDDFTVSLSYAFVKTLRLPRSRDRNLLPAPVDARLGIPVWSSNASFANPAIGRLNVFESTARALYSGLIVEAAKRFSRSFSFNFNYVLSRAMDDVVDYNSDFQAFDQTNQRTEWARSAFDQRHRIVAYGIWTAPGSVQISPMFRGNSSRPFNLLAGFDLNADRHDTTDRPAGAGRNTGDGPSFWTLDSRVARSFALGERSRLELLAEAFNVLNQLNFASVNNVVGNIPGPFRVSGRHDRTPSEPLGFTSAHEPRRVQLGVRVRF